MRKFHVVIHSLLLATSPALLAYPQCDSRPIVQTAYTQEKPYDNFSLTYDEVLRLLRHIESEKIQGHSKERLNRITHFVTFLAQHGMLPGDYAANAVLERDIAEVLNDEDFCDYAFSPNSSYECLFMPALLNSTDEADVYLCRHSKHHKKNFYKKMKDFIKKHRKAILIGAAVIVGATVVVIAVVAASSAGVATAATSAGAGIIAAAAPNSDKKKSEPSSVSTPPTPSAAPPDTPLLKEAVDGEILSFKETIFRENYFGQHQELSLEENGRTLGSLFAHESFRNLQHQIPSQPALAQEVQTLNVSTSLASGTPFGYCHPEIDRRFTTEYTPYYANNSMESNFTALSYQMRAESALSSGYYDQAVSDFGRAIHLDPTNPTPYLDRGLAHFQMGQYDRSLEDYRAYEKVAQTKPFCVTDFSLGFARGLPHGMYDSGKGLLLFFSDLVIHPVRTGVQVFDSFVLLGQLAKSEEWEALAQALAPEAHQLIKEWDTLPDDTRGELAGYIFGKYGTDLFLPAGLGKAIQKLKGAQELGVACKRLSLAERTLLADALIGVENEAQVVKTLRAAQTTVTLGEDIGLTVREMAGLKQAGKLENTVAHSLEKISHDPHLQQSYAFIKKAEDFLEPHCKRFMTEIEARELIHQTGMPTFPRPTGIPDDFRVKISKNGAGIRYVHPEHEHTSIRVMPGKPHSLNPCQRKPYVVHVKNGQKLNKKGEVLADSSAAESHIPFDEYIYRD